MEITAIWWLWLALGLILLTVDLMALNSFFLMWVGVGALFTGLFVLAFPYTSVWLILMVFTAASVAGLLTWQFVWQPKRTARLVAEARSILPGTRGKVTQWSSGTGSVQLPGPVAGTDRWRFRCSEELRFGDAVEVIEVAQDGVLEVKPATPTNDEQQA